MRFLSVLLATTLTAGAVSAQTATPAKPMYGAFGFDTAGMDKTIKPGDDFYDYANGKWLTTTEIPADRSNYGMFTRLQDLSLTRTRGILEGAESQPDSKIGNFYLSFMDEAAANAAAATPIKPWLAQIAAAGDKAALAAAMARLQRQGVKGLYYSLVSPDDKDPTHYIGQLGQSGLGLPDRDYYLKPDAKLAETRTDYAAYLTQLLTLSGEGDPAARAKAVIAFETRLAQAHWTRIDSRDATKTYNKFAAADFTARAPGFAWTVYLDGLGLARQPDALVAQPGAFAGEAKVWAETPLAVLKDWLTLRTIDAFAPYLSKPFVDAEFHFNGTVLGGAPQLEPRWKRGVRLVSDQMGEAIGKDYVARYFPPEAKSAADQLVRNIIAAYRQRLASVPWMAPETRRRALEKLAAFTPKIGYPSTWRDYSTLEIRRGDLVGNVARGDAFEYQRGLNKLGKPIDREEWGMSPMEINAYADFQLNQVVFPAAILQPPFFDPRADPAINYGGIGAVIGHELSHHFDDQGRKYDATGKLTDWWMPQDVTRFTRFTDALSKQYDGYEPLPGQHVQGGLTLGENMADLAGITVAQQAYRISLGGRPAPVIDGFTGDQRFFLGWAQVWRIKYREPNLRQRLLTDPHAPGPQRVDEVRNRDDWYAAFGVKPGDTLYLPPAERVTVW